MKPKIISARLARKIADRLICDQGWLVFMDTEELARDFKIREFQFVMKRGMPITIQDGYYVRLADPSAFQRGGRTTVQTTVYLVICPHCSHKNQQGVTECENCGASL